MYPLNSTMLFEDKVRTFLEGHDKVPEHLIVITDGKSADKVQLPAEKLRTQGVNIYAIGVKEAVETELQEIAGSPQNTFLVNNFDALKIIKDDIITEICSADGKHISFHVIPLYCNSTIG
jgi:collagen type VI alpha